MNECGQCNVKIGEEPALVASGHMFHVNHLLCDVCQCRVNDGERIVKHGSVIMCYQCHVKTTRPTCTGCSQFIESTICEALGGTWHPTCFQCSVCQQPLKKEFFQLPNKMTVHGDCYWDLTLRASIVQDIQF